MKKNVVSIVVPCYNGEQFVERFCTTILEQTYKKIQLIIVNDGSIDGTEEQLKNYEEKLKQELVEYIYVKKENGGQASAINVGLQYVAGEYLMWFDIDDLMSSLHVEKKMQYLQNNVWCDIVRCKGYCFDENDLDNPICILGDEEKVGTLFEDILLEQCICYPGLYMVRTERLLQRLNDRKIYEEKKSQNHQLLLPISLENNVGFLEDRLFYYIIREDSYSHSWRGGLRMRERLDNIYDIKMHVLKELPLAKDYFEFLSRQLELCFLRYRLANIDEEIIAADKAYVAQICKAYLDYGNVIEMAANRKIFIWGWCDFSRKIKENLERFIPLEFGGYIESDYGKVISVKEDVVLHRSKINKSEIYVIIPLNYHPDIVDILNENGLEEDVDYYYPKEKLREKYVGEKINN